MLALVRRDVFWPKLGLAQVLFALTILLAATSKAQIEEGLVHQHWSEFRTAHFVIYSSGSAQEVSRIGARLEQFRDAYGVLVTRANATAAAQAVVTPPIPVIVFPDYESMQPFLPLYNGKPANLAAFFKRSSDENIIVMSLAGTNSVQLETVYHEFTHLLFRHNGNIWPVWLNEGMAEVYSTFECTGMGMRIGKPIPHHLRMLARGELMPLHELLAVTHDSPQYNEADTQGIFYAESWALTHFLMNGDNPGFRSRFGNYTTLLRKGMSSENALTAALGVPLDKIEADFYRYLKRGQFESISYVLAMDLSKPRQITTRPIGPSEVCFRLGNELMRIDRLDAAQPYFDESLRLLPTSPLAYEGLGLLAAEREKPEESANLLKRALEHGSQSYLAHYVYAEQKFRMTADSKDRYRRVGPELATEIRGEFERAIGLMPNFGPAHESLGFFELVQGEDLASAEQQLQLAINLEPERQWYLIYLAEAQMMRKDTTRARQTLEPLTQSFVEEKLRARAREVLAEMDRQPGH